MSKAGKFIEEYTRNCSNEIGYCHNKTRNHNHVFYPWLTPNQARKAVEIAREEVIEKMCSFIDDNMAEYIDIKGYTGNTFINVESDRFINDLKQAMKNE